LRFLGKNFEIFWMEIWGFLAGNFGFLAGNFGFLAGLRLNSSAILTYPQIKINKNLGDW
jgi:hypothetical protein